MTYKVVHVLALPGVDHGESLLEGLDATFVKGLWVNEDEIIEHARDADAVIGVVSDSPFTRRVLGALHQCRIVAGIGVGYDTTDVEAATELGIVVTNVPDYCIDEVSGTAVGLMLALGRKLFQADRGVRQNQNLYTRNRKALMETLYPVFRMRPQTVGIIGLGKIGTATALKAKGLGMRVIAYDPYVLAAVIESRGVEPVEFDCLLKESDFISIHTPLNRETSKLVGYEEFRKMKRTCYFINTARGGCVDQEALVRALEEGLIAGAGIDVTIDEPISKENPLLKMGNVILTGHSAYYSTTSSAENFLKPVTQVVKAIRGEWPEYAVNPEVRKKWMEKWGSVPR
jgi:D-3-phosphoglycerate dehydrogenase